jgi:polygalacturonase
LIEFDSVEDVLLDGFKLLNAAAWHAIITGDNYVIRRVSIHSPDYTHAPNTDGFDVAANNVHIHDCNITNGDDSIVMKVSVYKFAMCRTGVGALTGGTQFCGGTGATNTLTSPTAPCTCLPVAASFGARLQSPAQNVLVERCIVKQGNGLVVGTSDDALFRNITFRNCTAISTMFGCHIKFKNNQTGSASGITFEGIKVINITRYAIGINQNGQSITHGVGSTPHHDHRQNQLQSNVTVNNIVFRNIQGNVAGYGARFSTGSYTRGCH